MIGIDIIDLSDPMLKKRAPRTFRLIQHPDDKFPEHGLAFWLLWTTKEAVFKCRRQPVSFAPSKIPVQIKEEQHQAFSFQSGNIFGKTVINSQYVMSICSLNSLPDSRVFYHRNAESKDFIRMKIKQALMKDQYVAEDELGLPIIQPGRHALSISHHHRYAAFAVESQTFQ